MIQFNVMIMRVLFLLVLSVSTGLAFGQQGSYWDLKRCVEYGMNNNISVRQAKIQADQSEINYQQSNLQRIPSLSYGLTHGFSFGRTLDRTTNVYTSRSAMFQQMSISSNVLLFNFNSLKNIEAANKFSMEADRAAVDKARNDIGLNIAQQYLRALLSYEQVEIARIVLDQTKAQYFNTRKLVDAGSLPELNAAELEATVARDSATVVQAISQAELDKLSLKALLNLPADQDFELVIPQVDKIPVDDLLSIQPGDVYQLALSSQPQIRLNDLNRAASEKNLLAAKGQMKPTITAFGQLASNFNQFLLKPNGVSINGENLTGTYIKQGGTQIPVYAPNVDVNFTNRKFGEFWNGYGQQLRDQFGQGLGLSINVPIFNGAQARSSMKRAMLEVKKSDLTIERDKLQLKQDVYSA
jgi:outer membrane protein